MPKQAPVALFIFNRPDHLRRTIAGLLRNEGIDQAPLIVFGDGPRRVDDLASVEAARAVAREMLGSRPTYRFAEHNVGLALSIIAGVNELTAEYGTAVVIEDDLTLAPGFLAYQNRALAHYADHDDIYQVSGHMFDVPAFANRRDAVLLPFTTTWGWGTWRRAWQHFDPDATGWPAAKGNAGLIRRFNLDGTYDYAAMMERQQSGRSNSWGIRWYWSVFKRDGLAVFPPQTLVANHGMDGAATHGRGWFRKFGSTVDLAGNAAPVEFSGSASDPAAYGYVKAAIYAQNGGHVGRAVDFAKRLLRR